MQTDVKRYRLVDNETDIQTYIKDIVRQNGTEIDA